MNDVRISINRLILVANKIHGFIIYITIFYIHPISSSWVRSISVFLHLINTDSSLILSLSSLRLKGNRTDFKANVCHFQWIHDSSDIGHAMTKRTKRHNPAPIALYIFYYWHSASNSFVGRRNSVYMLLFFLLQSTRPLHAYWVFCFEFFTSSQLDDIVHMCATDVLCALRSVHVRLYVSTSTHGVWDIWKW